MINQILGGFIVGKIKVSKEMGLALERVFEKGLKLPLGREGYLIYNYLNNSLSYENKILKKLSLEEITKLSFEGYEVIKTPEEKISEILNSDFYIEKDFSEGVRHGIIVTLNAYGHEIKGVNC